MRFQSYFNIAASLVKQYNGQIPFAHFLKNYFSQNKKHGSKDRKYITQLCYNYYRLGNALRDFSIEEKLKTALFICNSQPQEWTVLFEELWLENWNNDLNKRINFIKNIYANFSLQDIFLWKDELSEGIDFAAFSLSHFVQPCLFIRIRPDKQNIVKQKLIKHNSPFRQISSSCLSFPNSTKIDAVLNIDEEAVIQDYSSQKIQEFFQLIIYNSSPINIWDCCAASGGKSILANDVLSNIRLTVSDVRPTILHNLKKRFAKAGIKNYQSFVEDLSIAHGKTSNFKSAARNYNLIICDVPCSGSGTWSRTPEQLCFFKEEKINGYAILQKKIISNAIQHLKQDGYFLYITCSVFKKENEENVAFIQQQFGLQLIKQELLTGYKNKADTMFAALLSK